MSSSWNKSNNLVDKRINTNWDLLPPKPVKRNAAFVVFANERARGGNDNIDGNVPHLQDTWNRLSDGNKRRYECLASEQHKQEIEKWSKLKSDLKRPPGAYVLFMMDLWAEEKAKGKRWALGEISRKAKTKWDRASQRKKTVYKDRAKEMMTKYNAFYDGYRSGTAAVALSPFRK